MRLRLTRDSVAAGDDVDAPHARVLEIADDAGVGDVVAAIVATGYLPRIAGGAATWSVVSRRPLAVVAQQWPEPRLLSRFAIDLADLDLVDSELRVHLAYHAQQDPQVVLEVLGRLGGAYA